VTAPAPDPARRGSRSRRGPTRVARASDVALDAFVVALAAWTLLFHVARAAGWTVDLTFGLWLGAVSVAAVFVPAYRRGIRTTPPADLAEDADVGPGRAVGAVLGLGAAAGVIAGLRALDVPGWWIVWGLAVAALVAAAVLVLRAPAAPAARPRPSALTEQLGAGTVIVAAIVFALLAVTTVRPDTDDVYLVNRSVWVEQRGGAFPERDVLFSDEEFAITRDNEVETAIEPLVGAIARWLPWSSATVAYLAVAPVVSALGVLALWRLVRSWRVGAPVTATLLGVLFLAFGGAIHTSFGNFSFGRAWQGKVAFLSVVVPQLWTHALGWGRDRRARSLVMLVLASIAAVGLSSTATLVGPPVVALGIGAGVLGSAPVARARTAALGALALVAPLAAGLVAVWSEPQAPRAASQLLAAAARLVTGPAGSPPPLGGPGAVGPPDAWYTVVGTGTLAVIGGVAAFTAWAAVRDRAARLALIAAPLAVVGLFGAPAVLRLAAEAAGARSIVWRVVWIIPLPAMVGVAVTGAAALVPARAAAAARLAVPLAAAVAIVAGGTGVWSGANGASLGAPAWDVDPEALPAARRLVELARPGTTVAAPEAVGGIVAITTVDVRAHNPSSKYLSGPWASSGFQRRQRGVLSRAVEAGDLPAGTEADVERALAALGVTAACVRPALAGTTGERALHAAGFALVGDDAQCRYWVG
jgi:hypothetical protein